MENYGELRAYFFNNMYLQGIHAGVQSQHTTVEMFLDYSGSGTKEEMILFEWAQCHKTTIVLNGGMQSQLDEIRAHMNSKDNPYPWSVFVESEEALNGCLTNVGIILPEKIFKRRDWRNSEFNLWDGNERYVEVDNGDGSAEVFEYSVWEQKMCDILESKRLAN